MLTKKTSGQLGCLAASCTIFLVTYYFANEQLFQLSILPINQFSTIEYGEKNCDNGLCRRNYISHIFSSKIQNDGSSKSPFVLLVLINNQSNSEILRVLKNVVNMSEEIPVVALLNKGTLSTKQMESLPIHFVLKQQTSFHTTHIHTRKSTFLDSVSNILNIHKKEARCPKMIYKNIVSILTTLEEDYEYSSYTFSDQDIMEQQNVSFGDSEFHPYSSTININKNTEEFNLLCDDVAWLKSSLKYIKENYKNFKYIIVIDSEKYFTPNIVSYFKSTSNIFDINPSVYCVSAHNPLMMENGNPPEEELGLLDHFVFGGASLFPRKIIEEILNKYQQPYKLISETNVKKMDAMNAIENWFSWWSNRKLRSCIVPSRPRMCHQAGPCSKNLSTSFELDRLTRYQYFITIFKALETMKPLVYEELPCQNTTKPKLDFSKNETSYAVFLKMISQDDNLSLDFIFKCFGIEHRIGIGGFENLYKIYWEGDAVYIIGVPYSSFGPSIKKDANLYMLQPLSDEMGESLETILRAKDFEGQEMNLTTVPFEFKDDDDNNTSNGTSTE